MSSLASSARTAAMIVRRLLGSSGLKATGLALLSAIVFAGGLTAPASATPVAGEVAVDMVINNSGTETRSETVASGSSRLFIVKYSCSSAQCDNVRIDVPIAANVSISNVVHGSDMVESRNGSTVSWTAESLAAGVSSQITFVLSIANGRFADGSIITHQADISATDAEPSSSAPVTMTVLSDGSTSAAIERVVGGSVDAWTTYAAKACLHGPTTPGAGQLGVQSGSTLTLTLPTGATLVSSDGANVNGRVLTWTIGEMSGAGCAVKYVKVDYPSADPDNAIGATKTLQVDWDGAMVGRSQTTLGTATQSVPLDEPDRAGLRIEANISPTRQQIGDNVVARYHVGNGTNTYWRDVQVDAGLSTDQRTSAIYASTGRTAGSVWISVDGGPLVKAADFPSGSIHIDPYAATLPSGEPGLGAGQVVTAVRISVGGFQPGDSSEVLAIVSEVLGTTTDGVEVELDDQFDMTGSFTVDDGMEELYTQDAALAYTIYKPKPVITVRAGGGGVIPNGATTTMEFNAGVGAAKLADPVFVVRLPAALKYLSWEPNSTSLPRPTMTKLDNTPNAGQTLLRFTWPRGTEMARDTGYSVKVTSKFSEKAYGGHQAKGFVSSATQPYDCGDGWFVEGPDTQDLDNNGDTSRYLCAWGAGVEPITNVSAALVQSIKGSWDSDYSAGPSTSFSSPGSADSLRAELQNNGNIFLKNAVMVTKLPRPGDKTILGGASRNPATGTFPVVLDGAPVVPTLNDPVKTFWTTEANPCLPEIGSSPQNCVSPTWTRWSDTAPSDLADVVALKFDFGTNQLTPFTSWTVDLPVTTPTTGATEPDYAIANPNHHDNSTQEYAVATSAAIATRADISSTLNTIESTPVRLAMPSTTGPYDPPAPEDLSSTAEAGHDQSATVEIPTGGTVTLIGPDGATNRVEIAGEGVYVLNPATGVITFTPETGFTGLPSPLTYQVADTYGTTATATYQPEVTIPAPPAPSDKTSTGPGPDPQSVTYTVPFRGTVRLLDEEDQVVDSHTVQITGVGTYVLDPATGTVTFTPEPGYLGTPEGVTVAVTDAAGQTATATYTPTVVQPEAPQLPELSTNGTGTTTQHVTLNVPRGATVTLVDTRGHAVTELTVPGQGTYTLDPTTGVLTFAPIFGFAGLPSPVTYAVTDSFGQQSTATYAPLVQAPPAPAPAPQQTSGKAGSTQTVTISVPRGGTVALWDGTKAVTKLTIAGQGTYTINPATGVLSFTPVRGFTGTAAPVAYQVTDAYGQVARATYQATVKKSATHVKPGGAEPSTGHGRRGKPVNLTPLDKVDAPTGQKIHAHSLRVGGKRVLRTADGTWTVHPSGKVTFRPAADFVGVTTVPFTVRTSGGKTYRSTLSVIVRGVVTGRASTTVYFDVRSARLDRGDLAKLRALAARIPERATTAALSIGYVQPEPYTGNDQSLSRARAHAAAAALSRMADIDRIRISGRGRAAEQDWHARRAVITATWRLVQR